MAAVDIKQLESVLKEARRFKPSKTFRKDSHLGSFEEYEKLYRKSLRDPEKFWAKIAGELHWFKPWTKVLDNKPAPFYRWVVGGKTNLSFNCLDRPLDSPMRHKAAFVWEGEPGDRRVLTY